MFNWKKNNQNLGKELEANLQWHYFFCFICIYGINVLSSGFVKLFFLWLRD